jgi:hypothetical protein
VTPQSYLVKKNREGTCYLCQENKDKQNLIR